MKLKVCIARPAMAGEQPNIKLTCIFSDFCRCEGENVCRCSRNLLVLG